MRTRPCFSTNPLNLPSPPLPPQESRAPDTPQLQHRSIPRPRTARLAQKSLCWALKILLQLVYQSAGHSHFLSQGTAHLWLRRTSKRSETWALFIIMRVFVLNLHCGEAFRFLWFCCATLCRPAARKHAPRSSSAARRLCNHCLLPIITTITGKQRRLIDPKCHFIHSSSHGTPPTYARCDHPDSPSTALISRMILPASAMLGTYCW